MVASTGGRRRALEAALVAASLLFALLLCEGALRVLTPDDFAQTPFEKPHRWMAEDPILGFANRASFVHPEFDIDAHGFRGPPLREPKGAAERVACFGDSGTFGIWLDAGETPDERQRIRFENYPDALRRALADRGAVAEVINAGVVGYTAAHGLRLLETRVLPLRPDVVTVRFGLNDHKITPASSGRLVDEPQTRLARRVFYGVAGWRLMRLGMAAWRKAEWARAWDAERMVRMLPPPRFAANLRRFAELSREHDFALLFIDYPLRPAAWGEHEHYAKVYRPAGHPDLASFHELHRAYQRIVARVASEEGVPLLETESALTDPEHPGFGLLDFVHPSDRGAERLAGTLADALLARGWVGAGGS